MSWSGTFSYSWSPPRGPSRLSTSRTELIHLGIAYAVLTFDMLLIISQSTLLGTGSLKGTVVGILRISPALVALAAGAALTGFVAHEMAHKVAAQRHGFWAEFRVYPIGLVLSLVTAFYGFLFAAPGATMIGGMSEVDAHNWGRTSLAGPMSNLVFAALFYAGSLATVKPFPDLAYALLFLAFINSWFAIFNLIPFGPLDGRKVLRWNTGYWVIAFVGTAAVAAICFSALYYLGPTLGL